MLRNFCGEVKSITACIQWRKWWSNSCVYCCYFTVSPLYHSACYICVMTVLLVLPSYLHVSVGLAYARFLSACRFWWMKVFFDTPASRTLRFHNLHLELNKWPPLEGYLKWPSVLSLKSSQHINKHGYWLAMAAYFAYSPGRMIASLIEPYTRFISEFPRGTFYYYCYY